MIEVNQKKPSCTIRQKYARIKSSKHRKNRIKTLINQLTYQNMKPENPVEALPQKHTKISVNIKSNKNSEINYISYSTKRSNIIIILQINILVKQPQQNIMKPSDKEQPAPPQNTEKSPNTKK